MNLRQVTIKRTKPDEYDMRTYTLTEAHMPWLEPKKTVVLMPVKRWYHKPKPSIFVGWHMVNLERAEFAQLLKKIRAENREKTEVAA
jgi:hypothetical protein